MPDQFQKTPRKNSIRYFESATASHTSIGSIKQIKECVYIVPQSGGAIIVRLTNYYIISLAIVHELLQEDPNLDCIVTISAWNSYTQDAKDYCISNGIGLFKFREYFGALNFVGENFVNFTLKEDREDEENK